MKAIEKHEHFLLFISNTVKFFGLLILSGIILVSIMPTLLGLLLDHEWHTDHFVEIAKPLPKMIFGILLLLGMDQFIKYLIKKDLKPNWFIRHVDILIYIYVIYFFISSVYSFAYFYINNLSSPGYQDLPGSFFGLIFLSIPAIPIFVKMLFWTALGLVLRKIIPIIEEVKSLV